MSNNNKYCYYCGEPKTSLEHVPPRCFFPKSSRKELIRVPSCDKHNAEKSQTDEYIRSIFVGVSYTSKNEELKPVLEKTIRSLLRNNGSNYKKVMINPKFTIDKNGTPSQSVEINRLEIDTFLEAVLRGLFFYQKSYSWAGSVSIIPHFLISKDSPLELREQSIALIDIIREKGALGENPEVFYYVFKKYNDSLYEIGLCFYGLLKVTGVLKS